MAIHPILPIASAACLLLQGCVFDYPDPGCGSIVELRLTAPEPWDTLAGPVVAASGRSGGLPVFVRLVTGSGSVVADTVVGHMAYGECRSLSIRMASRDTIGIRALVWAAARDVYEVSASGVASLATDVSSVEPSAMEAWMASERVAGRVTNLRAGHATAGIVVVADDLGEYAVESDHDSPLSARVVYVGGTAVSYDIHSAIPGEGVASGWAPTAVDLSSGRGILAYGMVLVPEQPTQVRAAVEVSAADGEVLFVTQAFTVPLSAGHVTVVRGTFMHGNGPGSVVIDPSFDGSFNYEIN